MLIISYEKLYLQVRKPHYFEGTLYNIAKWDIAAAYAYAKCSLWLLSPPRSGAVVAICKFTSLRTFKYNFSYDIINILDRDWYVIYLCQELS